MTTTLKGRLLNDGTLGPTTNLGDLLEGLGRTQQTAVASALDTYLAALTTALNTQCIASGALAEGTNSATIKTAAITYYTIAGKFYAKAATDNIAMTAATAQVALSSCCYTICINAAGTVSSVKGTDSLTASGVAPTIPAPTAGTCAIGVLTVTVANAATFTAGTTDLSASDVAGVFANFAGPVPNTVTLDLARASLNAALLAALPTAL